MKREYPDGPNINIALVIIGQMLPRYFPFDPLAFGVDIARKYGDIAYWRAGPLRIYQLNHPDLAREILVEQHEKFYKPRLIKRALRSFGGEGLLTSDGAFWKQQRRLIQPAFHQRYLQVYGDAMVAQTLAMTQKWADGEVRDVGAEMTALTLRVIVQTLFGAELPVSADEIGTSVLAVLDAANDRVNFVLSMPAWVPTKKNRMERRALAKLNEVLRILIESGRSPGPERDDLLSLLVRAGMSDGQLRDEMMTLFLAGHETTSSALTWIWYLLARHPEVEGKLREELRRELGSRAPAVADLVRLPYTEMVVREAMRLYPPAPAFAREPVEDVMIGGYSIPQGSLVSVNTYALHHDERFFADAERFLPERFAKGWEDSKRPVNTVFRAAYV